MKLCDGITTLMINCDEHLQKEVPSATRQDLAMSAVKARKSIRIVVLRASDAYDVEDPQGAIRDRRKARM